PILIRTADIDARGQLRVPVGARGARARGRTGGRPSRLSADQVRTARRLYEQQDMTVAQIGDVLGVSRTTIYRTLAKHAEPVARRRAKPSPTM
ncbi:helix-turn-helix domain-containing protein, partial [Streptomyces sp. NPDC052101]|uniref:helix-turn-helix domain-containing protein n=1 Tax=Streptomyces sp. NPDC052101 TaxID=3155763 RepID=UPI00341B59F3